MRVARVAVWLVFLGVWGCRGQPPCGECHSGTVCELDGTCRALAPREGLRFSRALRVRADDWASTRSDRRSEIGHPFDEALLGGDAGGRIHLAFPLPEGEIVGAVLTLIPAPRASLQGERVLRTFRTAPFRGDRVSRRVPPRRIGRYGTARWTLGAADRPLRIDVTALVQDEDGERVHLAVEVPGDDGLAWRIASPLAEDPARHPSLDLRVR
ncbi:MAG: hypothetical protein AAGE52_39505 [Myxococcota bacterium]